MWQITASDAAPMTGEGSSTQAGQMDSMSPECTPLKHKYDNCFNLWFRDYLAASSENAERGAQPRTHSLFERKAPPSLSSLRERYEKDCGSLFTEYQACVKVRACIALRRHVLTVSAACGRGKGTRVLDSQSA